MKLLIKSAFTLCVIACVSCGNKSETYGFIDYNKNGELKIDISKLKKSGLTLKSIHLVDDKKSIKQGVNVDSTFRIKSLYSMKESTLTNKPHMNNWLAIDYDGNLDLENSYFYEAVIYSDNNNRILAEIHFQTSKYKMGKPYILYGNVSKNFSINPSLDTSYFNNEGIATFPLLNTKSGRNQKRFILIDESKKDSKGKKERRYIFGTLTFDK